MRRVKLHTEVRRDQIAEAVLAVAAEGGLSELSVAAVAHHVGISPSALYRHFPSKEAMLEATLERLGAQLLENVERARREARDPLEALGRLLMLHVQIVRESHGIPLTMFSEGFFHSPRRRERLVHVIGRFRTAIAGLVREAQRQELVRRDLDAETLALMFIGLFQPAAVLWHLTSGRFDITAHARRAWAVFRDSIRTSATSERPARPRGRRASAQEKTA
jgi:AcrR family transcriptional regulator